MVKGLAKKSPLETIPGVGKSIAADLNQLGIFEVIDLESKDPEQLYKDLCNRVGKHVDPCVLYTFRCAVYFARTKKPDPDLLKWWNWKDKIL